MKIFYLLALIPLVGKGIPGSSKVVCSPSTVQAHLGQDVVLSCRVEPPSDLTAETLEWKCGTDVVHLYRSGDDDSDPQVQKFKGRTSLNHQNLKDGNVSVTLTNVTKKDEGNYTCCLPNHDICSNVTLTVVLQRNNEDEGNYTYCLPKHVTLTVVPKRNSETHDHPGSALSYGGITAIVLCYVVLAGILVYFFSKRLISGQILLLF